MSDSKVKFWGTITHLGQTWAVVGPDGAPDMVKKALGSSAAIISSAPSAPLPVAPLTAAEDAAAAAAKAAADGKRGDADAGPSADSYERARSGRYGDPKDKAAPGAKWAMVRPPKAMP